jgi:hypothetical protein
MVFKTFSNELNRKYWLAMLGPSPVYSYEQVRLISHGSKTDQSTLGHFLMI